MQTSKGKYGCRDVVGGGGGHESYQELWGVIAEFHEIRFKGEIGGVSPCLAPNAPTPPPIPRWDKWWLVPYHLYCLAVRSQAVVVQGRPRKIERKAPAELLFCLLLSQLSCCRRSFVRSLVHEHLYGAYLSPFFQSCPSHNNNIWSKVPL